MLRHQVFLVLGVALMLVISCSRDLPEEAGTEPMENLELVINGAVCPFDFAGNTWFFTMDPTVRNVFKVELKGKGIIGFRSGTRQFGNGEDLTSEQLLNVSRDRITPAGKPGFKAEPFNLVITTLPLVQIIHSDSIPDDPKIACLLSVIDPSERTNGSRFWFPPHRAGIEIRGGLSRQFPKKSYSIEFWSGSVNEEVGSGTALFGLRDDGDWILDAMYVDKARMRNRLSTDIWMAMNRVPHALQEPKALNGTRGRFVELFLNNQYRGLYCLTERIDRNQLNLDRNEGISYKASYWSSATEFISGEDPASNSSETWKGWELEFQGESYLKSNPTVRWEPLLDFIRFTTLSSDSEFKAKVFSKIDLNNLVDYLIFMNVLGADDNTGKNTFFSRYRSSSFPFFITPWDLDATWGRKWEGSKIDLRAEDFIGVTGIPSANSRYCRPNAFFIRLMNLNPDQFREKLKQRWAFLKTTTFGMESIRARVAGYTQLFISSGAYQRESQRWPGTMVQPETETQFMLTWIEARIAQLDAYMAGL